VCISESGNHGISDTTVAGSTVAPASTDGLNDFTTETANANKKLSPLVVGLIAVAGALAIVVGIVFVKTRTKAMKNAIVLHQFAADELGIVGMTGSVGNGALLQRASAGNGHKTSSTYDIACDAFSDNSSMALDSLFDIPSDEETLNDEDITMVAASASSLHGRHSLNRLIQNKRDRLYIDEPKIETKTSFKTPDNRKMFDNRIVSGAIGTSANLSAKLQPQLMRRTLSVLVEPIHPPKVVMGTLVPSERYDEHVIKATYNCSSPEPSLNAVDQFGSGKNPLSPILVAKGNSDRDSPFRVIALSDEFMADTTQRMQHLDDSGHHYNNSLTAPATPTGETPYMYYSNQLNRQISNSSVKSGIIIPPPTYGPLFGTIQP
jgi:hypothetical protein